MSKVISIKGPPARAALNGRLLSRAIAAAVDLGNRASSDATSSLTLNVARLSSLCSRTYWNAWSTQGREVGLRRAECEDAIRAIRTTQGWRSVSESGRRKTRQARRDPASAALSRCHAELEP